jgi:single-stranded-DNA-specific exonuclease
MLQSKARWKVSEPEPRAVAELAAGLKLQPVVAKLLASRGFTDLQEADRFLKGGTDCFHDPFLLDGMEKAVSRIREALDSGEKIRIYGDYDADGVSSTSLMIHLMRKLNADFDYYIPHRATEGYGLNHNAVKLAADSGVSLIVTVDTGISAWEQVEYASELGIDVVVTDHHEPPERLPDACAVLNPKKPGCTYPYKYLAGVGVAFKLAHALLGAFPEELLEIAALGTVADLMPLTGENRAIVKLGLERLQHTSSPGLRALLAVSGVAEKEITASHLGFSLAPRINASGRLEHADDAVRLLVTEDMEEAEALAESLDRLNRERQRIVEDMTKEALAQLAETDPDSERKVIVLAQEGWNVGVIGIVAARILEKYYRPVLVFGIDPETGLAKGSARSIAGFDIYKALSQCGELLEHYGGHQAAAGMTVRRELLDELADRLNALAEQWLTDEDYIPICHADAECAPDDVTIASIQQIEALAPFGMGNPAPRFILNGLSIQEIRTLGKDQQHLKLIVSRSPSGGSAPLLEAVGFGMGKLFEHISPSSKIDLLGELGINEWNGVRKPQILIQDLRIPHVQVYDWRGVRDAEAKFADSLAASERTGKKRLIRAAVLTVSGDPGPFAFPEQFECGVWAMDEKQGVIPLDSRAKRAKFSDAEHVLLHSLPDRVEQLEAALRLCRANRLYVSFRNWDRDYAALPSRESFILLYKTLLKQEKWTEHDLSFLDPVRRKLGLSDAMIRFMLGVFIELEFIDRHGGGVFAAASSPRKRELSEAKLYRNRLARGEVEQTLVYTSAQELRDWIMSKLAVALNPLKEASG